MLIKSTKLSKQQSLQNRLKQYLKEIFKEDPDDTDDYYSEKSTQLILKYLPSTTTPLKCLSQYKYFNIIGNIFGTSHQDLSNFNIENMPFFYNQSINITGVNIKKIPAKRFIFSRLDMPMVPKLMFIQPIELLIEQLVSVNDKEAKQLSDQLLKYLKLQGNKNKAQQEQKPIEYTKLEMDQLVEQYIEKLSKLLKYLDDNEYVMQISHHKLMPNKTWKSKIIISMKYVELLTNDIDNYCLDILENGLPPCFGYQNSFQIQENMFKHITAGLLHNYGIFILKEEQEQTYTIPMADGSFEPVDTIVYNAFIITESYHERNIIRAFKLKNRIHNQWNLRCLEQ